MQTPKPSQNPVPPPRRRHPLPFLLGWPGIHWGATEPRVESQRGRVKQVEPLYPHWRPLCLYWQRPLQHVWIKAPWDLIPGSHCSPTSTTPFPQVKRGLLDAENDCANKLVIVARRTTNTKSCELNCGIFFINWFFLKNWKLMLFLFIFLFVCLFVFLFFSFLFFSFLYSWFMIGLVSDFLDNNTYRSNSQGWGVSVASKS